MFHGGSYVFNVKLSKSQSEDCVASQDHNIYYFLLPEKIYLTVYYKSQD